MKHAAALNIANEFVDWISDLCVRKEIVGSLKRGDKEFVHDIEILLILKPGTPKVEFGMFKPGQKKIIHKTLLDQRLHTTPAPYKLQDAIHKADAGKLKRFALADFSKVEEFCIEFLITTPEKWAIKNVISTGPRRFSQKFVTNIRDGGLLPNRYQYITGLTQIQERSAGKVMQLHEEADAIALLELGWIEPKDRHRYE